MKLMLLFLSLCLFAACGGGVATPMPTARPVATSRPAATATNAWYEGGALHDKTAADWLRATEANRLATAGDWVTLVSGWETMAEARVMAVELRTCVNGAAPSALPEMKVSDLAASCMVLMGWQPKTN